MSLPIVSILEEQVTISQSTSIAPGNRFEAGHGNASKV
jgi:hypothetical protein